MIIRISMVFFAALLVLVTIGRYRAEIELRTIHAEHQALAREIETELAKIQKLTLEVEVLQSKQRLAELVRSETALRPVEAAQLHSAEDFARLAGLMPARRGIPSRQKPAHKEHEFINHALAMADYGQLAP